MGTEREIPHPLHRPPWGGLKSEGPDRPDAELIFVGLPYDGGASLRRGAAEAPARLREISRLSSAVTEDGEPIRDLSIADLGDLAPHASAHSYFESAAVTLAKLPRDAFIVGLGGDHSVSIPLHRAAAERWQEPFGIVHVDAHPDLFEEYAGDRLSHACPLRRAAELARVGPGRIVSLGIRSACSDEVEYAREAGLRLISAKEIDRRGLEEVAAETAERLSGLKRIYFDLDIDAFDASAAPGTGYPEPGGFSSRDFFTLLELLFEALPIHSMGLVEVAPPLDVNDMTSLLGVRCIFEVMGHLQRRKRERRVAL